MGGSWRSDGVTGPSGWGGFGGLRTFCRFVACRAVPRAPSGPVRPAPSGAVPDLPWVAGPSGVPLAVVSGPCGPLWLVAQFLAPLRAPSFGVSFFCWGGGSCGVGVRKRLFTSLAAHKYTTAFRSPTPPAPPGPTQLTLEGG